MNLSLFNRFQGCLYGSLISLKSPVFDSSILLQNNILLESIKLLNNSEIFSLESWQNLIKKNPNKFPLAIIPLALFRHDYLTDFQDFLQSLTQTQILSPDDHTALFCWGYFLSSLLRERFKAENCLTELQSLAHGTILEDYLIFMKSAIQQGLPLSKIIETLISQPSALTENIPLAIALSFYCFIDTPENFSISIQRANQILHPLVGPLTGALAGTYHGLTGIPFFYQLKTERNLAEFDLPEQINQLWNRWSGNLSTNSLPFSTALASPLVIQRRSNLRLISQADYF